ncbi:MAG: uroporphyrinogen decarboxylase family protein [Planctomycetota bacterium]
MPQSQDSRFTPLPREEVVKAVEHKGPARVPLIRAKWWGEGLEDHYGDKLSAFEHYPEDAVQLFIEPVKPERMGLSWELQTGQARDSACVIDDWAKLDEFIEKLPDPQNDPQIDALLERARQARAAGMYTTFGWWRLFFERPWGLRGMQNLMLDYYEHPDEVHKLHDTLCRLYVGYIRRAAGELGADGFWTSDDLGHQTQPMISPAIFREFLRPYYDRVGKAIREANMHWWLHSCGNNTPLLDDLIDAGVDVFHPVQKGAMDQERTARDYSGRLAFLAGLDVQHALVEMDPDGVRAEVRRLVDAFDSPEGGLCLAAGNGILPGTPLENIEAFLDEALTYGSEHRKQFAEA